MMNYDKYEDGIYDDKKSENVPANRHLYDGMQLSDYVNHAQKLLAPLKTSKSQG